MTNTVLAQRWFRTVIRSTSKNSVAPPATQVYSALFLTSEFFDRQFFRSVIFSVGIFLSSWHDFSAQRE